MKIFWSKIIRTLTIVNTMEWNERERKKEKCVREKEKKVRGERKEREKEKREGVDNERRYFDQKQFGH